MNSAECLRCGRIEYIADMVRESDAWLCLSCDSDMFSEFWDAFGDAIRVEFERDREVSS